MRLLGIVLVILGALALGYEVFACAEGDPGRLVQIPMVVSGIVVVSGLLLLAGKERESET
jgi:hypothetical protein